MLLLYSTGTLLFFHAGGLNSSIQILGTQQRAISIRTAPLDVEQRTQLQTALSGKLGVFAASKTQIDTVSPTVGQQLLSSGLQALIVSFAGIAIYLSWRFQLDYALIAIIALFHDILITVGIFSILGLVQGIEADSLFIVALLTIAGFSVTDTVVIYERVRENLKLHPQQPIDELIDDSVRQRKTGVILRKVERVRCVFSQGNFGGNNSTRNLPPRCSTPRGGVFTDGETPSDPQAFQDTGGVSPPDPRFFKTDAGALSQYSFCCLAEFILHFSVWWRNSQKLCLDFDCRICYRSLF